MLEYRIVSGGIKLFSHIFRNNAYSDWLINNTMEKLEKRQNNPAHKYELNFFLLLRYHFFEKHHNPNQPSGTYMFHYERSN